MAKSAIRLTSAVAHGSSDRKISTLSVYRGSPEYVPPLAQDQYELFYRFINDEAQLEPFRDFLHSELKADLRRFLSSNIRVLQGSSVFRDLCLMLRASLINYVGGREEGEYDKWEVTPADQITQNHRPLLMQLISRIVNFSDEKQKFRHNGLEDAIRTLLIQEFSTNSLAFFFPPDRIVMEILYRFSPNMIWTTRRKYDYTPFLTAKLLHFVPDEESPGGIYFAGASPSVIQQIENGIFDGKISEKDIFDIVTVEKFESLSDIYVYRNRIENFISFNNIPIHSNDILEVARYLDLEHSGRLSLDEIDILKSNASYEEKAKMLDQYVTDNPGKEISRLVLNAFIKPLKRELAAAANSVGSDDDVSCSLPQTAPEIYQGLRGPETPPEFVKRVYAPWLGQGLDRAHIKHLDPKLYTAIDNWSRKPGNEWPADVDLPTRGEQTRRTIDHLKTEAPDGKLGKVLGTFTAREAQRIRSAIQRDRQKR